MSEVAAILTSIPLLAAESVAAPALAAMLLYKAARMPKPRCGGFSRMGDRHVVNEDSYTCIRLSDGTLAAAVADGVYQKDGGAIASKLVISHFERRLHEQEKTLGPGSYLSLDAAARILRSVVSDSARLLQQRYGVYYSTAGMLTATTFTAMMFNRKWGDIVLVMHVGNSRLYFVSRKSVELVTQDQEIQGKLTGFIGNIVSPQGPQELQRSLGKHSYAVLISDGLKEYMDRVVADKELREEFYKIISSSPPDEAAKTIVAHAYRLMRGLGDDASIVVVKLR